MFLLSMLVPMVDIWKMRMDVTERRVVVGMHVRLNAIPSGLVQMAVMLIVPVRVRVALRRVDVPVCVSFTDVQPYADRH